MDLGATIKKIRKDKELTQERFAAECGITQTYLSQIENNLKEPNLSTLKVISAKLDLPLPILFYLSMTNDDVPAAKREHFDLINRSMNALVHQYFAM